MRYQSKKQRKMYSEMRAARKGFIEQHPFCFVCEYPQNLSVHEILRGAQRRKAFKEPATWMVACSPCNLVQLDNAVDWPVDAQLALKLWHSCNSFDLVAFNEVAIKKYYPEDIAQYGDPPERGPDYRGNLVGTVWPVFAIDTLWLCICECGKHAILTLKELQEGPSCQHA